MKGIRQISDHILHRKPRSINFDHPYCDLQATYQIMLNELICQAGVGIAANQCADIAEPPQMMIVGIPDSNQALIEKVKLRYPDQEIPRAIVMINPEIIHFSGDSIYPENGEGCLSLRGGIRGIVKRDKAVTVKYFDMQGNQHTENFSGFAAHIVQHEWDHLQGIVFFQKILEELNRHELEELKNALEMQTVDSSDVNLQPDLLFDRDEHGKLIIYFDKIKTHKNFIDHETLSGIILMINNKLANY